MIFFTNYGMRRSVGYHRIYHSLGLLPLYPFFASAEHGVELALTDDVHRALLESGILGNSSKVLPGEIPEPGWVVQNLKEQDTQKANLMKLQAVLDDLRRRSGCLRGRRQSDRPRPKPRRGLSTLHPPSGHHELSLRGTSPKERIAQLNS